MRLVRKGKRKWTTFSHDSTGELAQVLLALSSFYSALWNGKAQGRWLWTNLLALRRVQLTRLSKDNTTVGKVGQTKYSRAVMKGNVRKISSDSLERIVERWLESIFAIWRCKNCPCTTTTVTTSRKIRWKISSMSEKHHHAQWQGGINIVSQWIQDIELQRLNMAAIVTTVATGCSHKTVECLWRVSKILQTKTRTRGQTPGMVVLEDEWNFSGRKTQSTARR